MFLIVNTSSFCYSRMNARQLLTASAALYNKTLKTNSLFVVNKRTPTFAGSPANAVQPFNFFVACLAKATKH